MRDINYLIRKDNIQKVYLSETTIDVVSLLKKDYNYIYQAILKEEFLLKSSQCNLFKELVFDEKVVGFCSYDFSREFMTAALNNIYILPEFRKKGLFYSELVKTMNEHNKPSIVEPTRLVVEILIRYGFAKRITDNIVASAIEFITPGDHVISNADYVSSQELSTHFYDLKICASIHFLNLDKGHIAYSAPLNYDIIHYGCLDFEVDGEYIENIKNVFRDNEGKLMEVLLDLEEQLPVKTYTLDEVIGKDNELSAYMESLIDDAHVTYADAVKIKNQIREEYEAGMILNESLLIRLAYLFDEESTISITSHSETCPYCGMPVDDHDRYCHFCGINLSYNPGDMFDSLINTFNQSDSQQTEDIRYIAYKFLKMLVEKIEFDYAVFTVENAYDISWEALKEFLHVNLYIDDSNSITEKGKEFLNGHPLHYYEKYGLDMVNYTDFEKYFYENESMDAKRRCISFLKQFDDEDISDVLKDLCK